MKTINVTFDEKEIKKLKKLKGKQSWREFILNLTQEDDRHVINCREVVKPRKNKG